jgi:hypothetical protein
MVAITQRGDPEGEVVQELPFTDIRDVGNFHTRGPNPSGLGKSVPLSGIGLIKMTAPA